MLVQKKVQNKALSGALGTTHCYYAHVASYISDDIQGILIDFEGLQVRGNTDELDRRALGIWDLKVKRLLNPGAFINLFLESALELGDARGQEALGVHGVI